jgi:hypothetical protein
MIGVFATDAIVHGVAVDVRRDDSRAGVLAMPAEEARHGHLAERLGEVADHDDRADVDLALLEVVPARRVDLGALVVEQLLRQPRLRGLEPVDEPVEPDDTVVARERHGAVREAGATGQRERCTPLAARGAACGETAGERVELLDRRRRAIACGPLRGARRARAPS